MSGVAPFRAAVQTFDDVRRSFQDLDLKLKSVAVAHVDTTGKQGGTTAQYYHLTLAEYGALHARSHALDGTSDHSIGSLTSTYLVKSDGTKLVPATNTDTQVSSAVTASHARSHALDSGSDHTGTLSVALGGTGKNSATLNSYLKGNATSALIERTYAEVKTDLSLNNVENTALSTWAGTSSITTLGTIGTGSWHGTTIDIDHGGTGGTTAATACSALGVGKIGRAHV